MRSQRGGAVLGQHLFEVLERGRVETSQVVVEHVDTRDAAACQVGEERIGREHLQVEYLLGAGHRHVNLELRVDLGPS